MSSTRHAPEGSRLKQERWASSPEFERGLLANLVAKRCRLLRKAEDRLLIWTLQKWSWEEGGLARLADELLSNYSDRLGTSAMRRMRVSSDAVYSGAKLAELVQSLPGRIQCQFPLAGASFPNYLARFAAARKALEARLSGEPEAEETNRPNSYPGSAFIGICEVAARAEETGYQSLNLENTLTALCCDPKTPLDGSWPWFFVELVPVLRDYVAQRIQAISDNVVVTEIGQQVCEALDYALEARCLTLVEGEARTGKTYAVDKWCEARPGQARLVEVPPGNDDFGFFRAIARSLGLSINLNSKANELRDRVEDVLLAGDLVLCLDEAHRAWPQANLHRGWPARINWIMSMINKRVPIALISTPQFLQAQRIVEDKTGWNGSQLTGRIKHYRRLPETLSQDDLTLVARSLLPEGDDKSIRLVVLYADGSAKYLAGIESVVSRARYLAKREGRKAVSQWDVKRAIQEGAMPSDRALAATLQALDKPRNRRRQPLSQAPAAPRPTDCGPAAETDFVERSSTPLQSPALTRGRALSAPALSVD